MQSYYELALCLRSRSSRSKAFWYSWRLVQLEDLPMWRVRRNVTAHACEVCNTASSRRTGNSTSRFCLSSFSNAVSTSFSTQVLAMLCSERSKRSLSCRWIVHYFTRSRTRGSDFPPFFSAHRKSQPSLPIAFVCFFGNGKGWLFVVGRVRFLVKSAFFWGWWSACVTGRTTSASDLLGSIWVIGARSGCTHCGALAR